MGWGEWYDSGVSLVLGIVLLVLGGIPLLNQYNVLSLTLGPLESLVGKIFLYLIALGGIWLLVDAFWGDEAELVKWAGIIVGIVLLGIGMVQLLAQFGVIAAALPGFVSVLLTPVVYQWLFAIEGALLVVSAFSQ